MAAKLEGRAFLSSFVDAVLNKLSSVKSTPVDPKLLRRLRASLRAARPVLDDAEQKQIKDQEIKKWLVDFHDALYMADDLLDELSTKASTQRDPGTCSSSWSRYVDSILEESDDDIQLVNSMQDIVDTLESVVEEKGDLGLKEEVTKDIEDMSWRIQSSLIECSDIYGRDKDKEAIVELLLDFSTCDDKLSVISVEGIGGIGKTTLAQLVYNDARVEVNFDIRAWVCVATKFDPVKATKALIEEITSCSCNMVSLNSLQTELKDRLTGKTFVIVLDDVWDNQQTLWDNFLKPFLFGNKGSKIVLTSRSENVDSVVSATNLHYKLDILSDEDCWSMFLKHSSLSTNSRQYVTLEQIGRKFVKKCKGLPLIVKTLGGLLRNKYHEEDWKNVLESEIWELSEDDSKIVPALRVSYHYLPSHLKRCFVYCSLYPEDYHFDKEELILLWMAEGLLQPTGKSTLEKTGSAYFNELVARSFFQPSNTNANLFVMHDLIHDLATLFAGEFYFSAKNHGNAPEISIKTRHLSYIAKSWHPISKLPEVSNGAIHMRSFLPICLFAGHGLTRIECDSVHFLLHLRFLRVLSFKCFTLKSLPNSIGELIHLRYLDLSFTLIATLPESLCKLYNLQTLKLRNCIKLEMLPSSMHDLVNLRHLDIEGASCLKEMPKELSKLKHLNFLSQYIVGKNEENGIRELGTLDSLHGLLCIVKLENVSNSCEALGAKMGNKKHINILELKWLPGSDIVDSQTSRDILEKLQPHGDLNELLIEGYKGETFPDWLGQGCFSYINMTKLSLNHCKNCCQLPSLGQLPSLKHLEISEFDALERIGCEFYKNNKSFQQETPFKSLESLTFERMASWREWLFSDEFDAFPQLKRLSLRECSVLTGDLPNHLLALEQLTIVECEQLSCSLPRAPKLHQLDVKGVNHIRMEEPLHWVVIEGTKLVNSILEWLAHTQPTQLQCLVIRKCSSDISLSRAHMLDSLQELKIWDCSKLTFSEKLQHRLLREINFYKCDSLTLLPLKDLPNLRTLTMDACKSIESIVVPQDVEYALPSLSYLEIKYCPRFVTLSTLVLATPHLESLTLINCPEIDSFPEGSLTILWIKNCQKLARYITSKGLHCRGLTSLILYSWDDVTSFPRKDCLPVSLRSLCLGEFPNLETLDCGGLQHLTSLKELTIEHCWKLENMTQEKLPSSITELHIKDCPLRHRLYRMNDPRIQYEN
ncbi:hypothetical protein PIB30_007893 [Stylosanthes scabra]|uniref:Disease resistance RPP13-like protein 1 n=1 Tax=Stylosanthes scabra TaxID=79078 RepID=A0ABU6R4B8_9FABA|nr:hypothetical protein [Stylosanthes scabra]